MKFIVTILFMSLLFTSCIPGTTAPVQRADSNATNSGDTTDNEVPTNSLPEAKNFLQLGNSKELNQLNIFADYIDSFIIRGNEINFHLSSLVGSPAKKYCLVGKYPANATTNSNEILVMAARVRNFYNTEIQAREYFLQVEVANQSANVSDCLTVNLQNQLFTNYATNSIAYSVESLCPNCLSNTASEGLKLFDSNGSDISAITLSHLKLGVIPALGSSGSGDSQLCTNDSGCTAIGFNCCLSGQCINHGEAKEGVNQSTQEYQSALQQILARPELIVNFQEYFYICPNLVPTNPDNNPVDPNDDPIQQANDLFIELQEYYNCLNPVIDEFSICTKNEYNVSEKVSPTGQFNFYARPDDLTFQSLNGALNYNNITGLSYAGIEIYKEKVLETDTPLALDPANGVLGSTNDSLSGSGQSVLFKMSPPTNPVNDTLKIRYRIDGTCEQLGTSLARCTKYYKQGQSSTPPRSSDHSLSQNFLIPNYANISFNVIVQVGGVQVAPGSDTWTVSGNQVNFSNDYVIFNNQQISITYFVSNQTFVDSLILSRGEVQTAVDTYCACGEGITCNLKPVYSEVGGESEITSYACLYPPTQSNAPLQKTLFMSSKTVAHKFYDGNGVNYEIEDIGSENSQECAIGSADESNCLKFAYMNDDSSRPNNSSYVGFNEILGSFNQSVKSPLPATKVDVTRGRQYDIFADEGVFSSCISCGKDYYSNLQKLFPDNFDAKGGGYRPNFVESSRELNNGKYNADDMKFGRACFVPPTMIPWTHNSDESVTTQRRNRLKAQHFMFANGYNKDWYGFDYGSLIGSFDGVKWFSVGNQRRIQATSNKLYLAINGYYGDLTTNNTFKIVVSETAGVINSGSDVTHDSDSDGAECQQAHFCSDDNDCITNLGYEYSCQNVGNLSTPWPIFDANANEVSGSTTLNLLSIVGGSNGQARRCVYRGRGSACSQDLSSLNSAQTFGTNSVKALNGCSANTYCASLDESKFNDRIGRYGVSAANQNNKTYITDDTDTLGLGTRVLGRPYNFYGDRPAPSGVKSHLELINVDAMCIPGKAPEMAATTLDLNTAVNTIPEADKILNIGRTYPDSISFNENYLAACPATDDDGNYTNFTDLDLNDPLHNPFAISQNISSNVLNLPVLDSLEYFNDQEALVTKKGFHKNSCLRAPGASCFTDLDCSPSNFIAGKFKTISNYLGQLNEAEAEFWKEDLICGNGGERYQPNSTVPNPTYDTSLNRCCRETGKTLTFYSEPHLNPSFKAEVSPGEPAVAGINIDIDSNERYSRVHTTYAKQKTDANRYPALTKAARVTSTLDDKKDYSQNIQDILKQYNTLHLNNSKVCCTGAWVREFAEGTDGNNGGHKFSGTSGQTFDYSGLMFFNWFPQVDGYPYGEAPFYCDLDSIGTPACERRNIAEGSMFETKVLKWLGKFELLGIPQVLIETNSSTADQSDDIFSLVDDNQEASVGSSFVIPGTIKPNGITGFTDSKKDGIEYYSAANKENFDVGAGRLKRVFSENKFNCCKPAGPADVGTTNSECCTGQFTTTGTEGPRCCLPGNTDVTVYTNRYVSSEGATLNGQPISDSDIDPLTGYIKKEIVLQLAGKMCCSGAAQFGQAIGSYPVTYDPVANAPSTQLIRRFIESDISDNQGTGRFDAGIKWNDHVYCDDGGSTGGGTTGGGVISN